MKNQLILVFSFFLLASTAFSANVTDTFNRADNLTSLTDADSGQTYTYFGGAVLGILSNKAHLYTSIGIGGAIIDSAFSNALITVTVKAISGDYDAIYARYANSTQFFVLIYSTTYGYEVYRYDSGYSFIAGLGLNGSVNDVITWRIDSSHYHTIEVNGANTVNFTDTAYPTATKWGLGNISTTTGGEWDDYSVVDLDVVGSIRHWRGHGK